MDRSGDRVGAYVLERRLGQGGFGAVWVGRHAATGARHALKLVDVGDPDAAARLAREVEALARLEAHPHAVRVHACFALPGGRAVVAGELVEGGGDLQACLAAVGPLPWPEAVRLVRQVAAAIAHAHARGVLHRDLKPANVLVDARGDARVIDLGLARLEGGERLTRTGEVLGTPTYLAPEQALGLPTDARADVFGLGALLFTCLTGSPPRAPGPPLDVLRRAAEEAPPRVTTLRADVPDALADLVERATALDPARRPPSAAAFLEALDAAAVAAGDVAARGGAPARRPGPRVAAAGALALLAVAGALALRSRPADPPDAAPDAATDAGPPPAAPASLPPAAPHLRDACAALDRAADAADVAAAAAAVEAALAEGAGGGAPPKGDLAAVASAAAAAQVRLCRDPRWASPAEDAAAEAAAQAASAAVQALVRLGVRAGLDLEALAAARREALDAVAPTWRQALASAADRDQVDLRRALEEVSAAGRGRARDEALDRLRRAWAPRRCRGLLLRLRALLAPANAPALGPAQAKGLDGVQAGLLVQTQAGGGQAAAWVLAALDAYRVELVDRQRETLALRHDGDLPVQRLRLLRASDAPPGTEGDAPTALLALADLDPLLAAANPGSRALAIGRLLRGLRDGHWDDAAAVAPVALAQDPAAQDDLAPQVRWAVEPVVAAVLHRASLPAGGGPLAPAIEALRRRAAALLDGPAPLDEAQRADELVNDVASLVGEDLGRRAEAAALREALLARATAWSARRHTLVKLACDRLAAEPPDPAGARAAATEAAEEAARRGDRTGELFARCALALVAARGAPPDPALAQREVDRALELAAELAATQAPGERPEAVARWAAGRLFDEAYVEAAPTPEERRRRAAEVEASGDGGPPPPDAPRPAAPGD